ncbi:MAG: hypothetical protein DRR19_07475 [Candidatus Parabeggiatoa sp. nov. 1]|nr:MAG: hypothetical protein DRR19_07475 [Gammaproteobacteria bacterium]
MSLKQSIRQIRKEAVLIASVSLKQSIRQIRKEVVLIASVSLKQSIRQIRKEVVLINKRAQSYTELHRVNFRVVLPRGQNYATFI